MSKIYQKKRNNRWLKSLKKARKNKLLIEYQYSLMKPWRDASEIDFSEDSLNCFRIKNKKTYRYI